MQMLENLKTVLRRIKYKYDNRHRLYMEDEYIQTSEQPDNFSAFCDVTRTHNPMKTVTVTQSLQDLAKQMKAERKKKVLRILVLMTSVSVCIVLTVLLSYNYKKRKIAVIK